MSVAHARLRKITARELTTVLIRDGFSLHNQAGSHQRYRHTDGRKVTVSFHKPSDTFPPKTLKRIITEQAQWTEGDLKRLKLLK